MHVDFVNHGCALAPTQGVFCNLRPSLKRIVFRTKLIELMLQTFVLPLGCHHFVFQVDHPLHKTLLRPF